MAWTVCSPAIRTISRKTAARSFSTGLALCWFAVALTQNVSRYLASIPLGVTFNLCMGALSRMASATFMFVLRTVALPVASIVFTFTFVMGADAEAFHAHVVVGLLLVCAGLLLYIARGDPMELPSASGRDGARTAMERSDNASLRDPDDDENGGEFDESSGGFADSRNELSSPREDSGEATIFGADPLGDDSSSLSSSHHGGNSRSQQPRSSRGARAAGYASSARGVYASLTTDAASAARQAVDVSVQDSPISGDLRDVDLNSGGGKHGNGSRGGLTQSQSLSDSLTEYRRARDDLSAATSDLAERVQLWLTSPSAAES